VVFIYKGENKIYNVREEILIPKGERNMKLTQQILDYIQAHQQQAYDLLLELAQIPAPSNHEEKRATFCQSWLQARGAGEVFVDDALNVILPIGCTQDNPLVVVAAHTDVVFPDEQGLPLKVEHGRICCPGVGDDTANLVAMLMAAQFILEHDLHPAQGGMLLVANAGEEGLGNLKGTRRLMERYGHRVTEFISLDAWNRKVFHRAVGSLRYRVEVRTQGGHSYEKFGAPNAIHQLSQLITALYSFDVPKRGKTTYNVGTIQGGTSVNTIAQQAQMLYEIRSDNMEDMREMEQRFLEQIRAFQQKGWDIQLQVIGVRPCMGDVDMERQHALEQRACHAVEAYFGGSSVLESASTDCNIPQSMGIPAVAVGCFLGGGAHTREEYVEIDSLHPGLKVAFEMILHYF